MTNKLKTIEKKVEYPLNRCLVNVFSESGLGPVLKELTA